MKQTSKQEIVKQIERACREDLDKLAGAGIPREILLTQLALIAERGPERMTRKTKEQLRDNRDEARSLSERIEKLTCKARKFVEADPFLGIQTPVYNLDEEWEVRRAGFRPEILQRHLALALIAKRRAKPITQNWKVNPASPLGMYLFSMESFAKLLKEQSLAFGKYLRENGRVDSRVDRGIDFIVGWILICNENFNCWEILSRLLVDAFGVGGFDDTTHITAEMLRKLAPRHRREWARITTGE